MRVVTFNWSYGVGSTGKIIKDIEECLPEIEFYHIFEYYGDPKDKKNVYKLSNRIYYRICLELARITGRKYDTGIVATKKALKLLKRINPDVVHIHCPNASSIDLFKLLGYLKKNKIRTIITNHAEFFYTGNCPHANDCMKYIDGCGHCKNLKQATNSYFFDHTSKSWAKMKDAMSGFDQLTMVAVSEWQLHRMSISPITKSIRRYVINNGVNTEVFRYKTNISKDYIGRSLGLTKDFSDKLRKRIIIHVTAHFCNDREDPKGGYYFLQLAKLFENNKDYVFVVAGTNDIIESIPSNMLLLGNIKEQNVLSCLYSCADISVITSRRETFGMSVAESLCCGTPVVAFKNGGSESVAIPEYSRFVDRYGDINTLERELNKFCCAVRDGRFEKKAISEKACNLYGRKEMAEKYRELYNDQ